MILPSRCHIDRLVCSRCKTRFNAIRIPKRQVRCPDCNAWYVCKKGEWYWDDKKNRQLRRRG